MTSMVELIKWPSESDWMFCKDCALVTVGRTTLVPPDLEWKKKILRARHSPIRELRFAFKLEVPYWVSVHLCRHVHAQPYVGSQRNDRQNQYDTDVFRSVFMPYNFFGHIYAPIRSISSRRRPRICCNNSRDI